MALCSPVVHVCNEQIFKGHITDIMSILMSFLFSFSFKTTLLLCFLLLFSVFNFEFTIFTFWYSIKHLGNKLGSSKIAQIGKTVFTVECLTAANTLSE